jgi:nitroimidazol reductase NimA-like FMN-containing flavoprotein (pyridoxamine 5'-phosphate oxidase superfamily)
MTNRGLDVLDRSECEQLLAGRSFGRVVTKIGNELSALPVYYAMLDGDIVFRTDPGTKLAAAVLRTQVVFEVDDEREGWSVMVTGHAEEVRRPADDFAEQARLDRLWPAGERERFVRIRAERITGRRLKGPR